MISVPVFGRGSHYLLLVAASGCVKQLPPAPIPPPVAPPVNAPAPPPGGHGRLVVDVVEGPFAVNTMRQQPREQQDAQGRRVYRFFEVPEILCPQTPCGVDLPQGNVVLGFPVIGNDDLESELVHIGPDPSVYRRSLSIYADNTGATRVLGIIGTALGGAAIVTGTVFLPIGLSRDNSTMTAVGGISMGGGALLLTAGILMMLADRPTFRPGASNHFPL